MPCRLAITPLPGVGKADGEDGARRAGKSVAAVIWPGLGWQDKPIQGTRDVRHFLEWAGTFLVQKINKKAIIQGQSTNQLAH